MDTVGKSLTAGKPEGTQIEKQLNIDIISIGKRDFSASVQPKAFNSERKHYRVNKSYYKQAEEGYNQMKSVTKNASPRINQRMVNP